MPIAKLSERVQLEREGKVSDDSPSSRFRVELLKGEPVNVVEAARQLGSTVENLSSVMGRLRSFGFRIESPEQNVFVVRNPEFTPSDDAHAQTEAEIARLRRRIAKLLTEGHVVDYTMFKNCTAQRMGSQIRYLRRTMDIERLSGPGPARYRLKGAPAQATAGAEDVVADGAKKGDGAVVSTPAAAVPAVIVGNDDGHDDQQQQQNGGGASDMPAAAANIPRLDEMLRVYFVARESDETILIGVLGPEGPLQLTMHG